MHLLLDNATASVVALVLMVIIVGMQLRVNQVMADRTAVYTAKKQTLEMAETLTRELSNAGSNMPSDQRITKISYNGVRTDTLEFWRVDNNADTLKVEYILTPADSIAYGDSTLVVYQYTRYQNGVEHGGSTPTIDRFRIDLLDDDGNNVGATEEVRQIRIYLSSVLPFDDPQKYYIPQTYWGTTLRPNSLR